MLAFYTNLTILKMNKHFPVHITNWQKIMAEELQLKLLFTPNVYITKNYELKHPKEFAPGQF